MCAIAGVFWFVSGLAGEHSATAVRRALATLQRRGPDERSVSSLAEGLAAGGNRLVIRGKRGDGSVPFADGHCTMYYNGEIYNHRRFASDAAVDGAVIIPLFRQYGLGAFGMLDGEFAISLWDARDETLVLARDPFGTRPLYFSLNRERLIWASSEGAINAMESHALAETVCGPLYAHTLAPQEPFTSYRGIWSVPPGHCLVANRTAVSLIPFHRWREAPMSSSDPSAAFSALSDSLASRLDYDGVLGIMMSGGIDSGIIAFAADSLGVRYRVYSVVKMFGRPTVERDAILRRTERLRNAEDVCLIDCDEAAYERAISSVFADDYYASERLDDCNVPVHSVMAAMARDGVRVAVDGSGGDELFHGYDFTAEARPIEGWPRPWQSAVSHSYYTLFSTLLDYTAKTDRAGAHFSLETRYPYQNVRLAEAAMALQRRPLPKWPLRRYLLSEVGYGDALPLDIAGKVGFSVEHKRTSDTVDDLRRAFRAFAGDGPRVPVAPFPFAFAGGAAVRPFIVGS
jgi:asparagine synthase (glutamine-hydrolysing)